MQEYINAVIVKPGERAYKTTIKNNLETLQLHVGGYIEVLYPFKEPVALICNEEGKINGAELNRAIVNEDGKVYDVIAGTFLIVGVDEDDFTSLTQKQADAFVEIYRHPQAFVRTKSGLHVVYLEE